jgi:hypothetical protein
MLPSWWRDDSTLIVIDIGIDESKSPPSQLLAVSAIVGNTGVMRKLDKEWKRELTTTGVDYFHAKEHWNGSAKPYHGISRTERDKLLNRLVSHAHHRIMFGVSSFVDEVEYKDSASERFRSQYGSPYGFAFQTLMVTIYMRLLHLKKANQPVNILIEDGHRNAQQAIGFIKEKKERGPGGLTVETYGLGGKKDNPILQAADMLAFGVCEAHTKGHSDFASRLAPPRLLGRFLELPWNKSAVEAVKEDILRNNYLLKTNMPGAKKRTELVMW